MAFGARFCPKCGVARAEGAFCGGCGFSFASLEPVAPLAPVPPVEPVQPAVVPPVAVAAAPGPAPAAIPPALPAFDANGQPIAPPKRRIGRRGLLAGLAAVLVLGFAGGGFLVMNGALESGLPVELGYLQVDRGVSSSLFSPAVFVDYKDGMTVKIDASWDAAAERGSETHTITAGGRTTKVVFTGKGPRAAATWTATVNGSGRSLAPPKDWKAAIGSTLEEKVAFGLALGEAAVQLPKFCNGPSKSEVVRMAAGGAALQLKSIKITCTETGRSVNVNFDRGTAAGGSGSSLTVTLEG